MILEHSCQVVIYPKVATLFIFLLFNGYSELAHNQPSPLTKHILPKRGKIRNEETQIKRPFVSLYSWQIGTLYINLVSQLSLSFVVLFDLQKYFAPKGVGQWSMEWLRTMRSQQVSSGISRGAAMRKSWPRQHSHLKKKKTKNKQTYFNICWLELKSHTTQNFE